MPTLKTIDMAFGEGVAAAWLVPRLFALVEFSGVRQKFSQRQLRQLALVISCEYSDLNVGDIDRWLQRAMGGRYGKLFYGDADPMSVTASLNKYVAERQRDIINAEQLVQNDEVRHKPPVNLQEMIDKMKAEVYGRDKDKRDGRESGQPLS